MRDFLRQLRGFLQLPALARELGFVATWHECSLEGLSIGGAPPGRVAIVGRRGALVCFGLVGSEAGGLARRFAETLRRRGQCAVVVALDEDRRELGVAVAGPLVRAITVALDHPSPLALGILARAADPTADSLSALATQWADALDGEQLGHRFFKRFRATLDRFVASYPNRIPKADRHGLALLQLTRVLFLYFVQDKGWLDGRPQFLGESVDRHLCAGRLIHRDFLHPLFFGTLNRPVGARSARVRRLGQLPFLNGGLFEPHPLEQRHRATLGNDCWREAFDDLFEKFHFTIATPDRGGGGIAPDMLGRVFEGVMDADERRRSGTFYTPSDLVDAMVEDALAAWLGGQLGLEPGSARPLLTEPTAAAADRLRRVTILDPAVGSGAFLLGALRCLVRVRVARGEARGHATRRVVGRNLYGVDLNPTAVRLAELRLWLEVINADATASPAGVRPLPNLDSWIRQGDSLLESIAVPIRPAARDSSIIARLRGRTARAVGPSKRQLVKALRRAETKMLQEAISTRLHEIDDRLRAIAAASAAPDLFGRPAQARTRAAPEVARCREERKRLSGLRKQLERTGELPWFHYLVHFADVMTAGGFDLVVGNPPWVRAEDLRPFQRRVLRERFRWYRANRVNGYGHLPDLSVAFLERTTQLTRRGGVFALLMPAKVLTVGYATVAREELARRFTLHTAADLTQDRRATFDATVYPLALIASHRPPTGATTVADRLGPTDGAVGSAVRQNTLSGAPWVLRSNPARARLVEAAARWSSIGSQFTCHLGVKTGANGVFLNPPSSVEPGLVRPAIRGRDIVRFGIRATVPMLWTHGGDQQPLKLIPPGTLAHLAKHERALRRRSDYQGGPYWTVFRTRAADGAHRVVWPDLARDLVAAPLLGTTLERYVPLNTCYAIDTGDRSVQLALAAWLNSGWIRALARLRAPPAVSRFHRFNASVVGTLPWAPEAASNADLVAIGRSSPVGAPAPSELDGIVARILDLPLALLDELDAAG